MFFIFFLVDCGETGSQFKADIDSEKSQLKILRMSGFAISPIFEITQKHYVSTTDFNVSKIQLQTWAKQQGATISVNGVTVSDITEHNLAVGNNEFTVSVSALDGSKDSYQLTVTRLPKMKYR